MSGNDRNATAEALLGAGAVLPVAAGTDRGAGAGAAADGVDVLTARTYAHPALEDRPVVRLVPEAVAAAEDLALEYLGFAAGGAPEPVGRVRRQSLGFPAWALVNDPANGHHALAVVKEMERLTRLVATKPGLAKEGFDEIGVRLDRSVPHFLPTYYEQVARLFLAAEARQQASTFFGKARAAEQRHALAVDEERLREVFLEFAGAGALTAKALRDHAKSLTSRLASAEAYDSFRTLSLERCAAGLAPYAGMLEDLRRLAKGAGLDAAAEERTLLAEIVQTGAIGRAAAGFWKSALPGLKAAAAGDPAVRRRLATLQPAAHVEDAATFNALWLGLLDACGATELLLDGTVPAAPWLSTWSANRRRGWGQCGRMEAELALVERMAPRLIADRTPVRLFEGRGWRGQAGADVLDLCLALGVPVAPPETDQHIDIGFWLRDEQPGRRDLAALAADERFGPLLRASVEQIAGTSIGSARLLEIVEHPALRTVLVGWIGDRADDLERPIGLPGLNEQLTRLSRFSSPAVLAAAPEAVDRITAFSAATVLERTLRAGVLDELGWPALEEALDGLGTVDPKARGGRRSHGELWYRVADAWPALVVRLGLDVALVGAEEVLDRRTLSLPTPSQGRWDEPTIRHVDGQWLVANGHGDARRAVWSGRPADAFKPSGELRDTWDHFHEPSLALPDGGRCFGGRPVRAGDTSFAAEHRAVASDGISVWVLHDDRWWEYDPASARRGRAAAPGFFDSALEDAAGQRLVERACRLLPVAPGMESSPFGSKDGLLGWWVRHDPKAGTMTACSVDGTTGPAVPTAADAVGVHTTQGVPTPPLRLPGGAVLQPRESARFDRHVELYDADGVRLSKYDLGDRGGRYAAGTELVPPLAYWHALRPRDEAGSARLRAVTAADARALLDAVAGGAAPGEAVARVLPELTHPLLAAGVAGVVKFAAECADRLAKLAEKAEQGRDEAAVRVVEETRTRYALDGPLMSALHGLDDGVQPNAWLPHGPDVDLAMQQVHRLAEVLGGDDVAVPDGRSERFRETRVPWQAFAGDGVASLVVRALSPLTEDRDRAALVEFVEALLEPVADGDAVFVDPRGRLRTVELKSVWNRQAPSGGEHLGAVRRDGRRQLLITRRLRVHDDDAFWEAVEYDPEGRFGAWEGFTETESLVLGAPGDPVRAPAVREALRMLRERGPAAYRPERTAEFAEGAGVAPAGAALVLLGLPGMTGWGRDALLPAEILATMGARVAEAETARETVKELSMAERREFTGLLLPVAPGDVAAVWEHGFDVAAAVGRWVAVRGRRRVPPPELVTKAAAELAPSRMAESVLNPETQPELTGRTVQGMVEQRMRPAEPEKLLTGDHLHQYVRALTWLAYRLPFGDPLRAVMPMTLRMLRERLADPGLLLDLHVDWDPEGRSAAKAFRERCGLPAQGGTDADGVVEVTDGLVLCPMEYNREAEEVWVRPAALLDGPAGLTGGNHPTVKLLEAVARPSHQLEALKTVLSDVFEALLTPAGSDGTAGAAQYAVHSAPELVAAAAGRFGLSEDAAALYLMLLALPDPTDRKQAEWTGWKPARLKKARAELAAGELVVEAKRARAGRTLFLPGGWQEAKSPQLPMETWKRSMLPAEHYAFVVPDRPVAALFADAWQRVVDGDAPGYVEFEGRGGRR
ncbi:hypothetical protein [Streptomyces solicathayae]|uniref:DNA-binding protein n=1 Tax=Streptomyces solicathayae TaxID=3081768 RepID=A0ABZ0LZB0_9ACTN|nr:hypothetical protein [Streptomyces sp. HUAS YS2]WOX24516.1 hypothetical protein R2D22_25280 [Streptomyces sp. HUAS YS2]